YRSRASRPTSMSRLKLRMPRWPLRIIPNCCSSVIRARWSRQPLPNASPLRSRTAKSCRLDPVCTICRKITPRQSATRSLTGFPRSKPSEGRPENERPETARIQPSAPSPSLNRSRRFAVSVTRASLERSLGHGLEGADLLDHRLPQRLLGADVAEQLSGRHRIDVAGDVLEALLRGRLAQHRAQIVAD